MASMIDDLQSPAQATHWLIQGRSLFLLIYLFGTVLFFYIIAKRVAPLLRGQRDLRFARPFVRLGKVLQFWLGQWKQPRYPVAGVLHIVIFAGFLVLSAHSISLLMLGMSGHFMGTSQGASGLYDIVKDYAVTLVFLSVVIAAIRRAVFRPSRYAVPPRYGKDHTAEAIFILALIATLMVSESVFAGSEAAARTQQGESVEFLAVLSLPWMLKNVLLHASLPLLRNLHLAS